MKPVRLTIVQTHPVQYMAPWFRYITAHCPEVDLTVLYASRPDARQQGVGFDRGFEWDSRLLDGYRWTIVRDSLPHDDFSASSYRGLDVRGIGDALEKTAPDVVLVPGWYSVTLVRAIVWARVRGIPVIYRGDTNNRTAPRGWRRLLWHLKTCALLALHSRCLSVGRLSREYLTSHGISATRIYASPACVDNDVFAAAAAPHLTDSGRAAARASVGAGVGDFVVLFTGKLEPKKRPLDAVEAVAALGPASVLVVAGSGPLEQQMRARAADLGVRVRMLGFVNQSRLGEVYAAADCLVLPSDSNESWGLVVNEAMATGLPAIVSDHVGCAADLIVPGETGEIHRAGDAGGLRLALERLRDRGGRRAMADACRARAARFDHAAATTGLVAACESLTAGADTPRVVACCGGMVLVSGMERMTFEVLSVVRRNGGAAHCIVNTWENHRIVELAERIGASWSTGFYWYPLARPKSPLDVFRMLWDVVRTSAGLGVVAARFRPSHVLTPDQLTAVRNALALSILRLLGVKSIFRTAMAPERGRLQQLLWRYALPPIVTTFVPISKFTRQRLIEEGIPETKITMIRNALSRRRSSASVDEDVIALARRRPTLLTLGQIAPFKGTHLAVEAVLRLLDEGYDVQGIILGNVPFWPQDLVAYYDGLRQRVDEKGASGRVHFAGLRENVLELMKASYLLSAPILCEEAFGNVALEARSVGLPVVTFASGGLIEQVDHLRTGYLCEQKDLEGLLAGLRYFLDDHAAREAASIANLHETVAPDNDCTATEFERRWWQIFRPPATTSAVTIRKEAILQ